MILSVQDGFSTSKSSGKQKLNQIIIIFSHSHPTLEVPWSCIVPSADGTNVEHVSSGISPWHCESIAALWGDCSEDSGTEPSEKFSAAASVCISGPSIPLQATCDFSNCGGNLWTPPARFPWEQIIQTHAPFQQHGLVSLSEVG